jgi:hypothetical protein
VLFALAFALRLAGLDHSLPHQPEPDNVFGMQAKFIRSPNPHVDFASYPLFVGYQVLAWPRELETVPADAPLERHLARATEPQMRARLVVAFWSAWIAPATWWLASSFLGGGWAFVAALFSATSLMHLGLSQQARPHAPLAAAFALALAAALHARRTGTLRAWILASSLAALPFCFLQSGVVALLPLFVAFWTRPVERRARDFAWLLVPVVVFAAVTFAFYPTLRPGSLGAGSKVRGESLFVGTHKVDLASFDGSGFPTLLLGLWRNDPVIVILGAAGLVACAFALKRASARRGLVPAAIVASFAAPYFVAFGLYREAFERFSLPLVPVLAVLAAAALAELSSWIRAGSPRALFATAVSLAALALPAAAAANLLDTHLRPDSLERSAEWVRGHLQPGADRVWLQPGVELPLASTRAAIEHNSSHYRGVASFLWSKYQETNPLSAADAFELFALPDLPDSFWRDVEYEPLRALASLGPSYVCCVDFWTPNTRTKTNLLRAALERFGTSVWKITPVEGASDGSLALAYNNFRMLADTWHATLEGPQVEIFAVNVCE